MDNVPTWNEICDSLRKTQSRKNHRTMRKDKDDKPRIIVPLWNSDYELTKVLSFRFNENVKDRISAYFQYIQDSKYWKKSFDKWHMGWEAEYVKIVSE